MQDNAASLLNV